MENEKEPDKKTESNDDLLEEARTRLKQAIDDEGPERAKMIEDVRFCTLDQWPADIRKERESDIENGPRPCLTIDKINQYIVQVVNDVRQGRPGIVVRPQDDMADVETAKILRGLIRNIEDQSKADIAYATAVENAAKMGLGFFRIRAKYYDDESWDQELCIEPLPNPFAVYLGPHIMPDGSDAKYGFIIESMPVEKFKEEYPGKRYKEDEFDDLGEHAQTWRTAEMVTVAEYYNLTRSKETLYFLADGTTMTKGDYDKWPEEAGMKPTIQDERTTFKEQLHWSKMTGVEVLEERDLPGKYIPIVEVVGRESWVEGKRHLWGLVRPAMDSLRMYNYWASVITEKMALQPKTPYIGAVGQFETMRDQWKKANRVNYAALQYDPIEVNGNVVPAPQRQGPAPIEAAMLQQMQVIEHDVHTSLGMFKAAVGETESQQSGRAILALQRESDTGTYHFGANLGVSIRHGGRILVDLIPPYYDKRRIVRILGEDGEVQTVQLDPDLQGARQDIRKPDGGIESIYNPSVGRYDVTITVGPSYNTKRMEAAATYVEMAKGAADPASAAILRYLVMRNSDTAGSDEAAKLLKTMLPSQALQAMQSKGPIPPEAQAMMQKAQQQVAQAQEIIQKLGQENTQLKAGVQADMAKVQADHDSKMKALLLEADVEEEKARLARKRAQDEINLKRWIAEQEALIAAAQADAEEERMRKKQDFEQECRKREMAMQEHQGAQTQ